MKKNHIMFLVVLMAVMLSCKSKPGTVTQAIAAPATSEENGIDVYYFHMTIRCATCRAVEAEARKNIEMLYPEEVNSGKITFTALNIDEDAGKFVGSQYNITGQTLLIVKGDKRYNLTKEGFLYAEGKPDKFQAVIREKVDSLLNN